MSYSVSSPVCEVKHTEVRRLTASLCVTHKQGIFHSPDLKIAESTQNEILEKFTAILIYNSFLVLFLDVCILINLYYLCLSLFSGCFYTCISCLGSAHHIGHSSYWAFAFVSCAPCVNFTLLNWPFWFFLVFHHLLKFPSFCFLPLSISVACPCLKCPKTLIYSSYKSALLKLL